MATHLPPIPMTWDGLSTYLSAHSASTLIVDRDGLALYPEEWAQDRRHYRPSEHERYTVIEGKRGNPLALREAWLICKETQRPLCLMWTLRSAPQAFVIEQGHNEAFAWSLRDDDRMTFVCGLSRLMVRLVPNHHQGGVLEPVETFRFGAWSFEAVSRAMNLADRVGERLTLRRNEQRAAAPERVPGDSFKMDSGDNAQ